MRYNLLSFILLAFLFPSCGQIPDPLRNKIELTNEIGLVSDSISYMETLLKKLPNDRMLGSFVDDDGYLYVNTKKIGLLETALYDSSMRRNSVFQDFSDNDYKEFISISIFLLKNHIDASRKDNLTSLFIHQYRRTEENGYNDIRDIMVNVDSTSNIFVKHYQILDRKENMVLVAPIDVKVH